MKSRTATVPVDVEVGAELVVVAVVAFVVVVEAFVVVVAALVVVVDKVVWDLVVVVPVEPPLPRDPEA